MAQGVTRRGLLGGAAAAGAAAAVPGSASGATGRPPRRTARVVIVGAGFAGLTAAREALREPAEVLAAP